jgi:hypothetical protein
LHSQVPCKSQGTRRINGWTWLSVAGLGELEIQGSVLCRETIFWLLHRGCSRQLALPFSPVRFSFQNKAKPSPSPPPLWRRCSWISIRASNLGSAIGSLLLSAHDFCQQGAATSRAPPVSVLKVLLDLSTSFQEVAGWAQLKIPRPGYFPFMFHSKVLFYSLNCFFFPYKVHFAEISDFYLILATTGVFSRKSVDSKSDPWHATFTLAKMT